MKKFIPFNTQNRDLVFLSISTAIILALSFPPFPIGIFACFGFVPFLIMTDRIKSYGRYFRYVYSTFFIFSLLTLYWVGGFTHFKDPYLMIAGVSLFFWQPLFFTLPATIYYFIRKKNISKYSVFTFPFIWVSFEWIYALGEFSFPWLTLGNTQTYNIEKVQFIEYTGVYGLSLWILFINVMVFLFIMDIGSQSTRRKIYILFSAIVIIYISPNIYSWLMVDQNQYIDNDGSISVGIVQPNVDPWEKWEGANNFSGRWNQALWYLQYVKNHINDSTDIVVLPESAILLNLPSFTEQRNEFQKIIDSLNISMISGYAKVKYYENELAPVSSNTIKGTTIRYDSYNSIFMMESKSESIQSFSKMRLVPFAERIPYADRVSFLIEPLRWGVGISNWGKGVDSTIFISDRLKTKFLSMVCYESIFPEFVASFVNRGAEFLIFITNDSWWGNTSGARQHNQYAILRAVENRRWVVRCANGGISSFIDPMGNMYDQTDMYTQSYIQRKITPLQSKTFYTLHGDLIGRISFGILLLILLLVTTYSSIRKQL